MLPGNIATCTLYMYSRLFQKKKFEERTISFQISSLNSLHIRLRKEMKS